VTRRIDAALASLALLALVGCGSSDGRDDGTHCAEGTIAKEGGGCTDPCPEGSAYDAARRSCAPVLPSGECAAGTMPMIGSKDCQPVGVVTCAEGFVADGSGGCDAILPAASCPFGQMAVPGEKECHEVAPCGEGTWGDIPVEPSTIFVDASYTGGGSDGTKTKPFVTIGEAVASASSTTAPIVAVAAGTYVEEVRIDKPLRLWGRCPRLVAIKGTKDPIAAAVTMITFGEVTVRGFGITSGTDLGIEALRGTLHVEQVWVHDGGNQGVYIHGKGSVAFVSQSLFEANSGAGIFVGGASATIESVVVRDTKPRVSDDLFGRGIDVELDVPSKRPAELTLRKSLIERNINAGVFVTGSTATIDATVVRDTKAEKSDDANGRGIDVEVDRATKTPSIASVRGSIVERNTLAGIFVMGSKVTVEDTVVRENRPGPLSAMGGSGIEAGMDETSTIASELEVRRALVDRNMTHGIHVVGSKGTVEATVVRDTRPQPSDKNFGRGIEAQLDTTAWVRAELRVRACLVERNYESGVSVLSSTVVVESTVVRGTLASADDGHFGDGVVGTTNLAELPASMTVVRSIVADNARAGLSIFGGKLSLQSNALTCNQVADLNGEPVLGSSPPVAADLTDLGGNLCGCTGPLTSCRAKSSSLDAPSAPIKR